MNELRETGMPYWNIENFLDPRRITSLKFKLLPISAEKKSGAIYCRETIPSSSRLLNLQCFRFVSDVLKQLNAQIIKCSRAVWNLDLTILLVYGHVIRYHVKIARSR